MLIVDQFQRQGHLQKKSRKPAQNRTENNKDTTVARQFHAIWVRRKGIFFRYTLSFICQLHILMTKQATIFFNYQIWLNWRDHTDQCFGFLNCFKANLCGDYVRAEQSYPPPVSATQLQREARKIEGMSDVILWYKDIKKKQSNPLKSWCNYQFYQALGP